MKINFCSVISLTLIAIFSACVGQQDETSENPAVSKIIFLDSSNDAEVNNIFIMNTDGSERTQITHFTEEDGDVAWPNWSPDGKKILYAMYKGEIANLYIIHSDGSGRTTVPDEADFQDTPCWSPDGTEVAYTTVAPDGERNIIKVVKIDGSGQYFVEDKERGLGYQTWSPIEALFALEFSLGGPPDIYTMSALDGSNRTQLTNDPKLDEWPAFSRDGKQIAWAHGVEGDKDIWVMNVDGSDKRKVTNNVAIGDSYPSFSPDGSQIAFTSGGEGGPTSIYIVNLDGTGLTKIATGANPAWSPFSNNS